MQTKTGILFIGQDPAIIGTLKEIAGENGYDVDFSGTGSQGAARIEQKGYDIVVMVRDLSVEALAKQIDGIPRSKAAFILLVLPSKQAIHEFKRNPHRNPDLFMSLPVSRIQWETALSAFAGQTPNRDNGVITARKQAEEALRKSEEKYKDLINNAMMCGVYQVTAQGDFIMANQRTVEMLGFDSVEDFFKTQRNIKTFYRDPSVRKHLEKEIEATGFVKQKETQFITRDGKEIWIKFNTRRIVNGRGRVCYEGLIEDITDIKHIEHRLLQAQRIEAIGNLAGGVAHDFNNILSPIIGYSELALEDCRSDPAVANNLKGILQAAKRAKDLVKQILTFARQDKQHLAPLRADRVAKEALKWLRSFLPKSIELKSEFKSTRQIMADATQIHQIFMNLFSNAAQSIPDQIGEITVKTDDLTIETADEIPDLEPGDYLRVTVSDTGHGIPDRICHKIFDPYFTTKKKGSGTGMGLAVVHGIVQRYGGRIQVHSAQNRGTTFTIFLPALSEQTAVSPKAAAPPEGGSERVMLVDDEQALLNVNQAILERLGYQVETFDSSLKALDRFRRAPHHVDLVITDMTMPKMTGDLLSKELLTVRPDLPIILLTGFNHKISSAALNEIGIRNKALKPLSPAELADLVRTALDTRPLESCPNK